MWVGGALRRADDLGQCTCVSTRNNDLCTHGVSVPHAQPKSKRSKVVTLARTTKVGFQAKETLIQEVSSAT